MELIVYPEGMFRADFDAVLDGARRQEEINPLNKGERGIAQTIHVFFDFHVLRLIRENEWVFDSARIFAEEYSIDCFRYLRTASLEIFRVQKQLLSIKKRVESLINELVKVDALKSKENLSLAKVSDFYKFVDLSVLDTEFQREAQLLYDEAMEHEDTHVWVTLRAIRDLYEIILPRVMFVVRRVIKTMGNIKISPSDNVLSGISTYLDWYDSRVDSSHALFPVLSKLRPFYKVARNVASHHDGFHWDSTNNLVVLTDENDQVKINLLEFQQYYRHLLYLCDFGIRGILSAYCGREKGPVSNELVKKYANTFPEDFPEGIPGRVKFYVQ